jgi:hypothetical protein
LDGKPKGKVYITPDPDFVTTLCGKNQIIKKSLDGLMISARRFDQNFVELLLRLGYKKNMHKPDI